MGYLNPLLKLQAGRALLALPAEDRRRIEEVMRALRHQANIEAEVAWTRRKGPMAAYWRAVATYARHLAHALSHGVHHDPSTHGADRRTKTGAGGSPARSTPRRKGL